MEDPGFQTRLVDHIRTQAKPVDKFSHQARLYDLARELAGTQPFDDDVLFAAAWLHDLGVFIGHRPEDPAALARWDHLEYVLQKGPEVLRLCGFPPEKIDRVLEAIRTHMPNSRPASFEGELLRDADILEQLGAVGILRTVSKVGRDTRFMRFSDALSVLEKNLRELPSKLHLDTAKMLAAKRIEVLRNFLSAAAAETGSIPW